MKKILFAATVLCMMGCQNKPTNSTPALDPSNMDTSVAPNESFYQYATGGRLKIRSNLNIRATTCSTC